MTVTDGSVPPRLNPLLPDDRSEHIREMVDGVRLPDGTELNLVATFAHNPGLLRRWWPFAAKLLVGGKLSARDRELVIMRTAWRCGCEYEWGQHLRGASQAGVTGEEVAQLSRTTVDDNAFSRFDRALVAAADELHDDSEISDATWAVLESQYDPAELIELCVLVGQYHMVAYLLRSLRIQREPGVGGFPE